MGKSLIVRNDAPVAFTYFGVELMENILEIVSLY